MYEEQRLIHCVQGERRDNVPAHTLPRIYTISHVEHKIKSNLSNTRIHVSTLKNKTKLFCFTIIPL